MVVTKAEISNVLNRGKSTMMKQLEIWLAIRTKWNIKHCLKLLILVFFLFFIKVAFPLHIKLPLFAEQRSWLQLSVLWLFEMSLELLTNWLHLPTRETQKIHKKISSSLDVYKYSQLHALPCCHSEFTTNFAYSSWKMIGNTALGVSGNLWLFLKLIIAYFSWF